MRERKEGEKDRCDKKSRTKAVIGKERRYDDEDNRCKDRAVLLWPLRDSDSLRLHWKDRRINRDSNQALSLYTMKIWPGIPLSPAIEM